MRIVHLELEPPLGEGRAAVSALPARGEAWQPEAVLAGDPRSTLAERIAALGEAGAEAIIVDLDRLPTPDEAEMKLITELVWSVLAAGARPVVVAGRHDTMDLVCHDKLDRAFAVVADLEAALAQLHRAG